MIRTQTIRHALVAAILSLPVLAVYGTHWWMGDGDQRVPTGFLHYDMPYYVANGRQYIDGEHAGPLYSNPFDARDESPNIYFQPHIMVLGWATALCPGAPGIPFVVLGLVCTFAAFFILSKLVSEYLGAVPIWLRRVLLVVVAWGGGLLCVAGTLISAAGLGYAFRGAKLQEMANVSFIDPLLLDPSQGLWFLNFGRNFLYPTEAFYHLLVVGFYFAVLKQRWRMALAVVWLLAACHPFTGVQYALIVAAWAAFERCYLKSTTFSWRMAVAFMGPALFCLAYYGLFLCSFEDHRQIMDQWRINFSLKAPTALVAYGPIALIAFWRLRSPQRFTETFRSPLARLFGLAAVISFVLANHEAFVKPCQPLHFTRGHIWLPLCLLGLPALAELPRLLPDRRRLGTVMLTAVALILLLDNAIFIGHWIYGANRVTSHGTYVARSELAVYEFIRAQNEKPIVLTDDPDVGYRLAAFSQARPYVGHQFLTPDREAKLRRVHELFTSGRIPDDIGHGPFWVLTRSDYGAFYKDPRFQPLYNKDGWAIYSFRSGQRSIATR